MESHQRSTNQNYLEHLDGLWIFENMCRYLMELRNFYNWTFYIYPNERERKRETIFVEIVTWNVVKMNRYYLEKKDSKIWIIYKRGNVLISSHNCASNIENWRNSFENKIVSIKYVWCAVVLPCKSKAKYWILFRRRNIFFFRWYTLYFWPRKITRKNYDWSAKNPKIKWNEIRQCY